MLGLHEEEMGYDKESPSSPQVKYPLKTLSEVIGRTYLYESKKAVYQIRLWVLATASHTWAWAWSIAKMSCQSWAMRNIHKALHPIISFQRIISGGRTHKLVS
jgi:hypothetical protein